MKPSYPYYLAGQPEAPNSELAVINKYTNEIATRVPLATAEAIERAIAAAHEALPACRALPAWRRAAALQHVAARLAQRQEELARILTIEAGKPIRDARGEISRAIETFRLAAEEATRLHGEYLPLDTSARTTGYEGIWKRVPIGPCSFISPFNFPVNLAAHKIAPAIAAGCPFVLKPASYTPVSAVTLGEILAETDLPRAMFSILPCSRAVGEALVTDERFKLLSFTGSPEVGWDLKARAGKKKVVLELGGNAACVVDRDVDVARVVERLIIGAFYQSGQSCISVQRILAHDTLYDDLCTRLTGAAASLAAGDPGDERTFIGPLISEADARRIESWVGDAVGRGARLLCGGKRRGTTYEATLLEGVADDLPLSCREAFGPVAILEPFTDFARACQRVNASRFGLQAGVFTASLDAAFHAFNHLEVGAVIINDVPSFRADSMPYGGVKDSGLGREGVRFAITDMTEPRLMVIRGAGQPPV
jgi:acyl-CoA reductase-like NAD-dependent aldehyde dehydrogenase